MSTTNLPEVWLRGPLSNIPSLLQPVAHTFLQAKEEIIEMMKDFPEEHLWDRPANVASPAFHLQHITGVIDRLFTYAMGQSLTEGQLAALRSEGQAQSQTVAQLVKALCDKIDWALEQLSSVNEQTLREARGVGRAQLPSTVQGLLFHSAEHTMRHVGQLLVTTKVIKGISLAQK
ncbi:DinB family protein [Chitinophagaceae bacterium LB-8]|uniref:DinB family protein n=1 Tax=Paraflavisolibacter caeni TaxID=2982496 RepID=A0A9X2XQ22_9BACT|nr:DinB family protein [Paraflavisolibacter caeni]MCU7552434.1 DinB family protein [Paraflavisolibacter caeni]